MVKWDLIKKFVTCALHWFILFSWAFACVNLFRVPILLNASIFVVTAPLVSQAVRNLFSDTTFNTNNIADVPIYWEDVKR